MYEILYPDFTVLSVLIQYVRYKIRCISYWVFYKAILKMCLNLIHGVWNDQATLLEYNTLKESYPDDEYSYVLETSRQKENKCLIWTKSLKLLVYFYKPKINSAIYIY